MGWTVNQSRRRGRLRRRPHLEHLDDRCLLSTGLEDQSDRTPSPTLREHAIRRRSARVISDVIACEGSRSSWSATMAGVARASRAAGGDHDRRRPAPATAYDPIIGAAQVRVELQRQRLGHDGGRDRYRRRLQQSGPGRRLRPGRQGHRRLRFRRRLRQSDGRPPRSTAPPSPGLIGSDDPSDLGVAPGVNIVALRVTDSTNTASLTSIANALQWVITNHAQYNITAVNMSLSDGEQLRPELVRHRRRRGRAGHQPDRAAHRDEHPGRRRDGQQLQRAAGRGIRGDRRQGTISVTATDLSGNLLPDAQRLGTSIGGASATTIAAPGRRLDRPVGRLGHLHGRRDQLRHRPGQRRGRPAPADLRVAVRHAAHGRLRSSRGSRAGPTRSMTRSPASRSASSISPRPPP